MKPALAVLFDVGTPPTEVGQGAAEVSRPVFVLGTSGTARASRQILEMSGPVVSLADGVDDVVRSLRCARVAGVTTFSERLLGVTALIAAELGLPYHDAGVVALLTDKFAQRRRLRETGVSGVCSVLLSPSEDWVGASERFPLPAVIKPVRGEGSRATHLLTDREQAAKVIAGLGRYSDEPFVLEEFIAGRDESPFGDYVSVECAVVEGEVFPIAVAGKWAMLPPFRESGQFWPARIGAAEEAQVIRLASQALAALGVRTGLLHVEIKLTSRGPQVLEVNGRLGGRQWDLSRRAMRVDLIEMGCRLALGESMRPARYQGGRVYFQRFCVPPRTPCTFLGVDGISEAVAHDGIMGYRRFSGRGAEFDGGVATTMIGMLLGDAEDHAAMLEVCAAALSELWFTFRDSRGIARLRGDELVRC
jgi:glutathione synthase/RimK-type ligase-like ATP-grasp enzyme